MRTRERKTNDEFNPVQAGREEKKWKETESRGGGGVVRKKVTMEGRWRGRRRGEKGRLEGRRSKRGERNRGREEKNKTAMGRRWTRAVEWWEQGRKRKV